MDRTFCVLEPELHRQSCLGWPRWIHAAMVPPDRLFGSPSNEVGLVIDYIPRVASMSIRLSVQQDRLVGDRQHQQQPPPYSGRHTDFNSSKLFSGGSRRSSEFSFVLEVLSLPPEWKYNDMAQRQCRTSHIAIRAACRKTHGAPLVVVEVGLVHIERCLERDCPMRIHRDNAASIAFARPKIPRL